MHRFTICLLLGCALATVVCRQADCVEPKAQAKSARSAIAPAMHLAPVATPEEIGQLQEPFPLPPGMPTAEDLYRQTSADVQRKSWGCVNCHQGVMDMHDLPTVKLGCIDCHGGDPSSAIK